MKVPVLLGSWRLDQRIRCGLSDSKDMRQADVLSFINILINDKERARENCILDQNVG